MRFVVVDGTTEIQIDADGDGDLDDRAIIDNGQFNLTETSPGSLVLEAKPIMGTAGNDTLSGFNEFDDLILGLAGADALSGGERNDTLNGGDGGDVLIGGAGDDVLIGGANEDLMYGGMGDDVIDGGSGVDIASYNLVGPGFLPAGVVVDLAISGPQIVGGGHGTDTLTGIEFIEGTAFNDSLYGDGGDNRFSGIGGDDYLDGRGGSDTADYNGSTGSATVSLSIVGPQFVGGAGSDTLVSIENLEGSAYNDALTGDGGDNVLAGALGNDTLSGLNGNDTLNGGLGDDILDGGDGVDVVNYSRPYFEPRIEGVGVDLAAGEGGSISGGELDTLTGIENVVGTEFGDEIFGDVNPNVFFGLQGADTMFGRGGNDTLFGGPGNDFLRGDAGPNDLTPGGNDVLIGGDGDDVMWGAGGTDAFFGGAGFDRVSFAFRAATQGVVASLVDQTITNDGFGNAEFMASIEGLGLGTRFVDAFTGNDFDNYLVGDYQDILVGNGGDDFFFIGAAPATLSGGDGIDTILQFNDFYWVEDANSDGLADQVFTTSGVSIDMGSAGNKILDDGFGHSGNFTGIENVSGGFYDDTVIGDGNNNVITGYEGNDQLDGAGGVDTVNYEENIALLGIVSQRIEGVAVNLSTGVGGSISGGETDTLTGIENVIGTGFDDDIRGDGFGNVFVGLGGADFFQGNGGDDTIDGGTGDDFMQGGDGSDTLIGGDGNDQLVGARGGMQPQSTVSEFIHGGAGDDFMRGGTADDVLDGGEGFDRLSYFGVSALTGLGVTIDLNQQTGTAQNTGGGGWDTLISIEDVSGSELNDLILGSDANESLHGGGGDDIIHAGGGNDVLLGDGLAIQGNDLLDGGNGADTVDYNFRDERIEGVAVNLTSGQGGTLSGGETDTLVDIENVIGTAFGDQITGDIKANTLTGNGGSDTLTGGAGADTFLFITPGGAGDVDQITDFSVTDDTIGLDSEVFPLAPGALGADGFHIGSTAADASDRVIYDSATGALWFDADGNGAGAAIQFATLGAGLSLTSADFIII